MRRRARAGLWVATLGGAVFSLLGGGRTAPAQLADFMSDEHVAATVDDAPFQAELSSLHADGHVTLQTSSGPRTLTLDELVSWGVLTERARGPQVLLRDGGWINSRIAALTPDHVQLDSPLWGSARLQTSQVSAIVFRPPVAALARDRLADEARSRESSHDRLWLDNGDAHDGAVLEPTPEEAASSLFGLTQLRFQVASLGSAVSLPVDRILAVAFNPALAPAAPPGAAKLLIGLRDGSRLAVAQMTQQAEQLELTLAGGARLQAPQARLVSETSLLQPFGSRVLYLSDVSPLSYRHVPFLQISWPEYGADRNVLGGQLRADGKLYAKGIGMHSTSRLAFALPEDARLLQAQLAVDDEAGWQGSVVFSVYRDDPQGGWSPTPLYQSDIIRGRQQPVWMSADVRGAQRIALIVQWSDQADVADYANWLELRVLR